MDIFPKPQPDTRFGFHYFPDTEHYRESDLNAWLPEVKALGASWIVLQAPAERAIPEPFLKGVIAGGVEPILHFQLPLDKPPQPEVLRVLFETYARWGVHYVVLFDRPNRRRSWSTKDWAQSELVERFIDVYLPLAESAVQSGLFPVFPPLEPGGDYWDTAFLRSALAALVRRGSDDLVNRLVLSGYAWPGNHSLNWGAGGPERWAGARPYLTPPGEQDQRGFRIMDWYLTITQAVLGKSCPILILGTGCHIGDLTDESAPAVDRETQAKRNLVIRRLMAGEQLQVEDGDSLEAIPEEVLAANFWVLAASPESPYVAHAWFKPDGDTLPVVGAMRQWNANRSAPPNGKAAGHSESKSPGTHRISHYLLLPEYEWGIADWHLDVIRPFVKKHRPTVGFSIAEANLAARVTVVGGKQSFSDELLQELRDSGCQVERIDGDGTSIATQLKTR